MPELMIKCPNKGREIATGIEISAAEAQTAKGARMFTRCPHCGILHGWSRSDSYLKEAPVETLRRQDRPAEDDAAMSQWVVEA